MALLDAGFGIDPQRFGLGGSTVGDVLNAQKRYAEREKVLLRELGVIQELYVERLMWGLELLQGISEEKLTEEVQRKKRDVEVFLAAMEALKFQLPLLRGVQREYRVLILLV